MTLEKGPYHGRLEGYLHRLFTKGTVKEGEGYIKSGPASLKVLLYTLSMKDMLSADSYTWRVSELVDTN